MIGIDVECIAAANNWNTLKEKRLIQDTIGNFSMAIVMGDDGQTFYTWNRKMNGETLNFNSETLYLLKDDKTHSLWTKAGG